MPLQLSPHSLYSEYFHSDTLVSAVFHSAAAHNGDMGPMGTSATVYQRGETEAEKESAISRPMTSCPPHHLQETVGQSYPVLSDRHSVYRDRLPRDIGVEALHPIGREESSQVGLSTHKSTVKVCASHINLWR
jgi:hypothetical protein